MEVIGRAADLKFRNSVETANWPLVDKISALLDPILALVGVEKQIPDDGAMEESESDDDY